MNFKQFQNKVQDIYTPEAHEVRLNSYENAHCYFVRCKQRIDQEICNLRKQFDSELFDLLISVKDHKIVLRGEKQQIQNEIEKRNQSVYKRKYTKSIHQLENEINICDYNYKMYHAVEKKIFDLIEKKEGCESKDIDYIYYHLVCGYEKSAVPFFKLCNEKNWQVFCVDYFNTQQKQEITKMLKLKNDDLCQILVQKKDQSWLDCWRRYGIDTVRKRLYMLLQRENKVLIEHFKLNVKYYLSIYRKYGLQELKKISDNNVHCDITVFLKLIIDFMLSDNFDQEDNYEKMKQNYISFFARDTDSLENKDKRQITYDNTKKLVYSIIKKFQFQPVVMKYRSLLLQLEKHMVNRNLFYIQVQEDISDFIDVCKNLFLVPMKYFDLKTLDPEVAWTADTIFEKLCLYYNKDWECDPYNTLLSKIKNKVNRFDRQKMFKCNWDLDKVSHKGVLIIHVRHFLQQRYPIIRAFLTRLLHIYKQEKMQIIVFGHVPCTKEQLLLNTFHVPVHSFHLQEYNIFPLSEYNNQFYCPMEHNECLLTLYKYVVKVARMVKHINGGSNEQLHDIVKYIYNFMHWDNEYSLLPNKCSKASYDFQTDILQYICFYQTENILSIVLENYEFKLVNVHCKNFRIDRCDSRFYSYIEQMILNLSCKKRKLNKSFYYV